MVDLPRVDASKEATKVKPEEEAKRWQKMQKEAERQRFERKMFAGRRQEKTEANKQQQQASRDADVYRFRQNEEYNKFKKLIKDSGNKAKDQYLATQNKNSKLLKQQNELKNNLQRDITNKTQNNAKLTEQTVATGNREKQKLTKQQKSLRNTAETVTKNATKNSISDGLERKKQQQIFQQDKQRDIADNNQLKQSQDKKNKLLQSKQESANKSNLHKNIKDKEQHKIMSDTTKLQNSAKLKSATTKQLTDDMHKTQQQRYILNDATSNAKKQHLRATTEKQQQDKMKFHFQEATTTDIKHRNQDHKLNATLKEQQNTNINKNQQNINKLKKSTTDLEFINARQHQDDTSNQQNIDQKAKNYLLQQQAEKSQTAKKSTDYNHSISQQKQEKDEIISVDKLYQEHKILPLPQHINPNSTITQALQDPAQRVEIINHIVELIKTYRPFIVKDGAFNIVMPGAFWEGTKIVVDMYKKNLGVKISASEKIVNVLTQNKLPLTEALKTADPELNITVDIEPVA